MLSSRTEGFRYEFGSPLPCTFEVTSIDGQPLESKTGEAVIINISPHGLKLGTQLDIPIDGRKIGVRIDFVIMNERIVVQGHFVWQKRELHNYTYGIHLTISESVERTIIEELKRFTKHLRQVEALAQKE